jgi:hypothetical protein
LAVDDHEADVPREHRENLVLTDFELGLGVAAQQALRETLLARHR